MNLRRFLRRIVLYPALLMAGCNVVLTGFPIPLWHIEQLDTPHHVKSICETHLILDDGQKVALPFVKTLPQDNPLFEEALSDGIELSPTGEVVGLMWSDRNCGNDPYLWRKLRVNLSDFAGALNPLGIDDSRVHPDVIDFIQEHKRIDLSLASRSHQNRHLTVWDGVYMRSVRKEFDWSVKKADGTATLDDTD